MGGLDAKPDLLARNEMGLYIIPETRATRNSGYPVGGMAADVLDNFGTIRKDDRNR